MPRNWFPVALSATLAALGAGAPGDAAEPDAQGVAFFENKIRPVLVERCYKCHSEKEKKSRGGLRLDTRAAVLQGGDSGPAVVPGRPQDSLLVKAIRHADRELKMPPDARLADAVVADFVKWVALGAPDPRDGSKSTQVAAVDWDRARDFWAFQPPRTHRVPKVRDARWPRKESDFFLLAELEKRGLKPVGAATRRELIRRATFDLTGLPPTPDEVDAFLEDTSADAFARVVERLLSSPHHGERWGRYWLDVARYADDQALAFTTPSPHAHRYRDWVIRALNADMPYDRFLRLQLAGDLLPGPAGDYVERLAGLGFQGLGAKYHRGSVPAQVIADELDDRIDTLSRGLLGLTVACARCHDHKYDPIPTRDYYGLAAAYHGAAWADVPLAAPKEIALFNAWQQESKQKETNLAQWVQERGRALSRKALMDVDRYLLLAWKINAQRKVTYKSHKIPPPLVLDGGESALATAENLHPYFVERAAFLAHDAKTPLLAQWRKLAGECERRLAGTTPVAIPGELQKAAAELKRQLRMDLERAGSDPKQGTALLKELGTGKGGLFAIAREDVPKVLGEADREQYLTLQQDLEKHRKVTPPAPLLSHGVSGGGKAMPVYLRGNVERPGELAPPGFLRILQRKGGTTASRQQFTRLDLADAIATAENPLTARVFVNRVWHYHFGRGIVGTPSNFGKLGDRPTHPELLDTLAVRFVESGWSIKWLHREIMLSAAYQLGSASDPRNAAQDPDNLTLWRMTPRRLDVEAWRDALLAVSGRLDNTLGGPSLELNDAKNVRRTVYAKVSRHVPSTMLALFDFPDANITSDRRGVTTVPQQQLFVLNSDLMIDSARAFAARLARATMRDEDRLALAFRLAYGRPPTATETQLGLEFLRTAATGRPADRLTAWEQYAQALLATNEFTWVE